MLCCGCACSEMIMVDAQINQKMAVYFPQRKNKLTIVPKYFSDIYRLHLHE